MRVRILSRRIKDNYIDISNPPAVLGYTFTLEENNFYNKWKTPSPPNIKHVTLTRMSGCDAGVPEKVAYVDMDSFKELPKCPRCQKPYDEVCGHCGYPELKSSNMCRHTELFLVTWDSPDKGKYACKCGATFKTWRHDYTDPRVPLTVNTNMVKHVIRGPDNARVCFPMPKEPYFLIGFTLNGKMHISFLLPDNDLAKNSDLSFNVAEIPF